MLGSALKSGTGSTAYIFILYWENCGVADVVAKLFIRVAAGSLVDPPLRDNEDRLGPHKGVFVCLFVFLFL